MLRRLLRAELYPTQLGINQALPSADHNIMHLFPQLLSSTPFPPSQPELSEAIQRFT